MKLSDIITEGGSGSGRPAGGARPPRNLWFQKRELWLADLRELRGTFELLSANGDTSDIFATDNGQTLCYGVWRQGLDQGVTFIKSRPLTACSNPRIQLKKLETNIA